MNTLFTDYCAHVNRANQQGFVQMPFTQFVRVARQMHWGDQ